MECQNKCLEYQEKCLERQEKCLECQEKCLERQENCVELLQQNFFGKTSSEKLFQQNFLREPTHVDRGLSRGSCVCTPVSEDPPRRARS